jgi:hypothetical protein
VVFLARSAVGLGFRIILCYKCSLILFIRTIADDEILQLIASMLQASLGSHFPVLSLDLIP